MFKNLRLTSFRGGGLLLSGFISSNKPLMSLSELYGWLTLQRFRITVMENGRNDNVTTFILQLPLAVFSFLVKFSSFALASKARIILHCSHLCAHCFKKTLT